MLDYQTDACKNAVNKRKPIQINIQQPQYIIKVTRQGKSVFYPTIGDMFGFDVLMQIIMIDWTNRRIHTFRTPFTTTTFKIPQQLSELETTISQLLSKNKINEKYIVDLFTQEAYFESKRTEIESKYDGKEIVVCGGEIFVGDDINQLLDHVSKKYPARPFFSYSLKHEYSTF